MPEFHPNGKRYMPRAIKQLAVTLSPKSIMVFVFEAEGSTNALSDGGLMCPACVRVTMLDHSEYSFFFSSSPRAGTVYAELHQLCAARKHPAAAAPPPPQSKSKYLEIDIGDANEPDKIYINPRKIEVVDNYEATAPPVLIIHMRHPRPPIYVPDHSPGYLVLKKYLDE